MTELIELLRAFLPESNYGKIIGFFITGFIVLTWLCGKIKLEWKLERPLGICGVDT